MSKIKQYPGVSLSVVAWLETRDVLLFVGEHTLQVGAEAVSYTHLTLPTIYSV